MEGTFHAFNNRITDDGGVLVDRAFSGDAPMLAINELQSESEKGEQRGFSNLVKGTFSMFRNTTANLDRVQHCREEVWYEELERSVVATFTKSNRFLKTHYQEVG
ncbi:MULTISPECIES: TIGR02391 family protein [Rhizobium/Agrobacterium group]|uniref:TIGR02391 family protein n=1 Tax=Rhizobium/Agrobacterium group TaxID=227290 RepID=UPI0022EC4174|nr:MULTISPECIES: TIGR02391 family protein [Rhizobium/Agrobacterium group]